MSDTRMKARLRELRLSQAALARKTEINVSIINQVANGNFRPSERYALAIAGVLGLEVEDIFPPWSKQAEKEVA